MPTDHKDVDQAATNLLRWVAPSVGSGFGEWVPAYGSPISINYGFRAFAPGNTSPMDTLSPDAGGFQRYNAAQIKLTEVALALWGDVANLTFNRVNTVDGAYANFSDTNLLFANFTTGEATEFSGAFANWDVESGQRKSYVWMNGTIPEAKAPVVGQWAFETFLHEIGHALTLDHPGEYNAGPNENITYNTHAEYVEDTTQYTVMSYFDERNTGANWGGLYAMTPMIHDIAAVQELYGANMTTRDGNTVYGFNSTETPEIPGTLNIYGMAGASEKRVFSVWDAGGTDTFDFSKYATTNLIDIRNGKFSSVGGLTGNIGIAFDPLGADELIENAVGGSGKDTIQGNTEDNELSGKGGDDIILGDLGNDKLDGGTGNDFLQGDEGDDEITGGDGTDTASYAHSDKAVTVDLQLQGSFQNTVGEGFDFLAGIENLTGSGFNDVLIGDSKNNRIDGGAGNDDIADIGGNDTLIGGAGINKLIYENAIAGVTVSLAITGAQNTVGAGTDTISGFLNLVGSNSNDKLTGNTGINFIFGGTGNDIIDGGAESDNLNGEDGDDILIGGFGGSLQDLLDGGAELILGDTASYAAVTVSVSASLLAGTASHKVGVVTDSDLLFDIENLTGGSAADQLSGDGNANNLDGGAGNDKLVGDAGKDTLIGGAGNDELQGDDGDDLLIGGAGADTINGGADADTVSYAASTAGITIELSGALGIGGDAAGDVITLVENVVGSAMADKILGSVVQNTLKGGAGNDTLDGAAGIDTLDGGTGNDILIGNTGADILIGGDGVDTASYANAFTDVNVSVNGAGFGDEAEGDQLFSIENLIGSKANDILGGDGGVNSLTGGKGDDTLFDTTAGDGIDVLLGGEGDDTITGYAGDKLDGGLGDDTLTALYGVLGGIATANLTTNTFKAGNVTSVLAGFEHLTGDDSNNVFTGSALANKLTGGNGDDAIQGMAGADILDGDGSNNPSANDTVVYAASTLAVTIDLTKQGTTTLAADAVAQTSGHAEGDALYGFENVIGSTLNDVITGDANSNIIEGGGGNDVIDAGVSGAGGDTISFASATASITFNLGAQSLATAQNTGGAGSDKTFGFENVLGGNGADKLTGDTGKNTIDGRAGNDIIQGGAEADKLIGGLGVDTLSYANSLDRVIVDLIFQGTTDANGSPVLNGAPQDKGDAQDDLIWGFENLIGTVKNDNLFGDHGANKIEGGDEFDHINGRGGNDILDGGALNDTVRYDYLSNLQHVTVTLGAVDAKFNVAASQTSGVAGDIDTISNFEDVLGGAGNDVITGNAGNNILSGNGGDDRLSGMAGIDGLNGGTGNDILEGGLGDDFIDGEADNDTASYKAATIGVTVDLSQQGVTQNTIGAGSDTLSNIENLLGSARNDTVTGDSTDNVIEGGLGNDMLEGGIGTDTLSYAGSAAAVTVSLAILVQQNTIGAGLDTATGFENLTGGMGADKLTGDGKDNVLSGGAGNDILIGGDGTDAYVSGAGADKITDAGIDGKGDIVYLSGADGVGDTYDLGADSNDAMEFKGATAITLSIFSAASIEALNANGLGIVGTTAADNIDLSAFTTVNGLGTIDGLGGNDTIIGTLNADVIMGGLGNDILKGGANDDTLNGGAGVDNLDGGTGDDTIIATGVDAASDILAGGADTDTLKVEGLGAVTLLNFNAGTVTGFEKWEGNGQALLGTVANNIFDFIGVTVTGLTVIDGGSGNDTITGSSVGDTIIGGLGNDILNGGAGNDKLTGGAGIDTIDGGDDSDTIVISGTDATNDIIKGGSGHDFIEVAGTAAVTIAGFDATASSIETWFGINAVIGTAANEVFDFSGLVSLSGFAFVDGGIGNDTITGTFLDDILRGGAGNDVLNGANFSDQLNGDTGNDTLNGGNGGDRLDGGFGTDILTGGADSDTFRIVWGQGADTVTDFVSGTDEIELDLAVGMTNPLSIISNNAPANAGPSAALLYDTDDGKLYYDSGPGVAVHIATLTGTPALVLGDFTFV